MERTTRISVFESEIQQEIQIVKSKLDEAGIPHWINDKYMTFTTTPTASTLKVMVDLEDEKKAFEIIDSWIQETENNKN